MNQKLFLLVWIIPISLIYLHTTNSFDQDLGRHIKLGGIIWTTREVPKTNVFSYTNPNEPVFNSHWGSQVLFYLVHKNFGVEGLILTNTVINTLAFGLIFWFVSRSVGFLIPSALFIPFSFMLLDRTWIRPEMFGNLFFCLLLLMLFIPRARRLGKWLMPVMALLWVNLHITAFFGLFVMVIVLVQDTVDANRDRKNLSINLFILILVFLASLVNPYGTSWIVLAVTLLSKYGYSIVENQSLMFLKDFGPPLVSHIFLGFTVLIISFFAIVARGRKILLGEVIILVVTAVLTLRFVRNEILFAYVAFVVSSLNFSALSQTYPLKNLLKNQSPLFLISMVSLLVSMYLTNNYHTMERLPIGIGSKESYRAGVDFFLNENLRGPIFNNFDIGGYLVYRLYPKERVFVDNRPEAYPVSFFQETYIPMQITHGLFEKVADKYGIQTVIWSHRDITPWSGAFLTNITRDKTWQMVYRDHATVIYIKGP